MIIFGEAHLRHVIREYVEHCHDERNHQGICNRLIDPPVAQPAGGSIERRKRLGGMLNFYYRRAA